MPVFCLTPTFSSRSSNKTEVAGLNNTVASAEQYFSRAVLKVAADLSEGIGLPDPALAGCLAATWLLIFLSLARGVQSSGKFAYFNALFPYGESLWRKNTT